MKKVFSTLLVFALIVMSLSLAGCSTNKELTGDELVKEQAKVKASARLAEEKINTLFDKYEPTEETTYYVAKERFSTIDEIKAFLNGFYTEEMTNKIVDSYIKTENVPDKGDVVTLTLPEDYATITGHEFTEADKVEVNGDEATITFTSNEKTVTYKLVKKEDKWFVSDKEVK